MLDFNQWKDTWGKSDGAWGQTDFGQPPTLCDQGSQSQTSSVGRGVMNGGLCPGRDHHIPPEPLCGVQQSVGGRMPGGQPHPIVKPQNTTKFGVWGILQSLKICDHQSTLLSHGKLFYHFSRMAPLLVGPWIDTTSPHPKKYLLKHKCKIYPKLHILVPPCV